MSSYSLRALIGFGGALIMLLPVSAEAQIVRRYAGGGVHVRAPLVRVNVNPYGGTSVRAPFVAVDPGSVRVGLRRRLAPIYQPAGPPAGRPTPAAAQPQVHAQGSGNPAGQGYVPFPTAEELAAMDDAALFTAINDLGYSLDVRLSRLATGAGWQRYLRIPESALRDPANSLGEFEKTLARYDSVSDNPEFAKIAGLPSFIATKSALRQTVGRLADSQTAQPIPIEASDPVLPASATELLPTPATAEKPEATRGERSILKPTPAN